MSTESRPQKKAWRVIWLLHFSILQRESTFPKIKIQWESTPFSLNGDTHHCLAHSCLHFPWYGHVINDNLSLQLKLQEYMSATLAKTSQTTKHCYYSNHWDLHRSTEPHGPVPHARPPLALLTMHWTHNGQSQVLKYSCHKVVRHVVINWDSKYVGHIAQFKL